MLLDFIPLLLFGSYSAMLILVGLWSGYKMGRQTIGAEPEPREFNPGPVDLVEEDPYEVAMRSPEEERRIQTMEGEK